MIYTSPSCIISFRMFIVKCLYTFDTYIAVRARSFSSCFDIYVWKNAWLIVLPSRESHGSCIIIISTSLSAVFSKLYMTLLDRAQLCWSILIVDIIKGLSCQRFPSSLFCVLQYTFRTIYCSLRGSFCSLRTSLLCVRMSLLSLRMLCKSGLSSRSLRRRHGMQPVVYSVLRCVRILNTSSTCRMGVI